MSKTAEKITRFCQWATGEKGVRAKHLALYAYLCAMAENSPREAFTIEAREVMKAIHVRRRNDFFQHLNDLNDWGFIRISKGKNQFVRTQIEILEGLSKKEEKKPSPRIPAPKETKEAEDKKKEYAPGVYLTPKEYERLCRDYDRPTAENFILQLSEYQKRTGKTYANHNATIRNWIWRNLKENEQPTTKPGRGFQKEIPAVVCPENEYKDSLSFLDDG